MNIRKGDLVVVTAGNDRGRRATVRRAMPKKNQVIVEGIHQVYKHLRRDRRNPQGGRLQKEAPIDASNVMVVCPKCDAGVRVGYRVNDKGVKVRICRTCKAELPSAK